MHRLVMHARPEQQVLVQDRAAELFRTHRFLAQIIRIPFAQILHHDKIRVDGDDRNDPTEQHGELHARDE